MVGAGTCVTESSASTNRRQIYPFHIDGYSVPGWFVTFLSRDERKNAQQREKRAELAKDGSIRMEIGAAAAVRPHTRTVGTWITPNIARGSTRRMNKWFAETMQTTKTNRMAFEVTAFGVRSGWMWWCIVCVWTREPAFKFGGIKFDRLKLKFHSPSTCGSSGLTSNQNFISYPPFAERISAAIYSKQYWRITFVLSHFFYDYFVRNLYSSFWMRHSARIDGHWASSISQS